ncbi:MAG: serine/threonine protein kinase [Drouetiella hepatica Uher 2000/2452]|uniref:Serine/threonine protein kinase n=1 Tax=Drouetiella hepatica Uher 2000/2452 TaxID=904376 RepID=A0A951Q6Y4_9CYAN|nr:serine/threonine protein kinase [Drouetiella hepatica Uher 2000/2452]
MSKRSNYRLLGLVGQGQFGQVYCAASRQNGRLVALKRLDHQRFPTHKFLRELRFLLSLRHPNIVACQAVEHMATGRHLVMDYCEGGTLRSLMTEENRLSLPQSLKLVIDVLKGLAHAHDRGIVHCDIKPENILVSVQLDGWVAKISDFGIARLSQEVQDRETSSTGSPAYMAPERFYGEYSHTSDLYSVGVLLFELAAGHRPFSGTPLELRSAHLNQPVTLPDAIPAAWRPIILTALQKLSARRFKSATEMLMAVQAIASSPELNANMVPLLTPITEPPECILHVQQKQSLDQPITALAVLENSLYRVTTGRVICDRYATSLLSSPKNLHSALPVACSHILLQEPVDLLSMRSQGCFVVTGRSVYLMPTPTNNSRLMPIQARVPTGVTAISPQGDWLASVIPSVQGGSVQGEYTLSFARLSKRSMKLATAPVEVFFKKRLPVHPQIFALDNRHVVIAMQVAIGESVSSGSPSSSQTLIKAFTRRGSYVASLLLPFHLDQAIVTQKPYQLLAIDRYQPQTIGVIDLKPYRIRRFAISIEPTLLAATDWGYILANSAGQILLLDFEGRQLGQLTFPEPITAIAPFDQRGLLVATWTGQQGSLHTLDLNEIGADLLF